MFGPVGAAVAVVMVVAVASIKGSGRYGEGGGGGSRFWPVVARDVACAIPNYNIIAYICNDLIG